MNENENEKKPEDGQEPTASSPQEQAESPPDTEKEPDKETAAEAEPSADATEEHPEPADPELPATETVTEAPAPSEEQETSLPAPAAEEQAVEVPAPSPEEAAPPAADEEVPREAETPVAAMFASPPEGDTPPSEKPDAETEEAEAAQGQGEAGSPAVEAEEEQAPEPQPLRCYEYRFVRVKQNGWDPVEAAILNGGGAAVAEAGGQLYGVWLGQIGLSANQGIVVTAWQDLESAKRHGSDAVEGINDITASETLYVEPTARPENATPPEGPGIFAHRVFEVRREDVDRFIELSTEAWPEFEQIFGARIFALWRETGHDRANERLILLTRYPDYAAWEQSRYWRPEPDPNAAGALQRFRERREITVDTVVYTTRLAERSAS